MIGETEIDKAIDRFMQIIRNLLALPNTAISFLPLHLKQRLRVDSCRRKLIGFQFAGGCFFAN